MALLVEPCLPEAASFVLCVPRRVKDHHNLLHESPHLKKACVRQVALDKWFPPEGLRKGARGVFSGCGEGPPPPRPDPPKTYICICICICMYIYIYI